MADTNPFRYSGEYFDAESGNIYLRNRYYDASTGRFISEDPAKDGTNWYVYCGGNPIKRTDSDGLSFDELWWTMMKYDLGTANRANALGNDTLMAAQQYMYDTGLTTLENNKADAWRHFLWSASMTREMGVEQAEFVGNNHEFKNLKSIKLIDTKETSTGAPSVVRGQINQATIMDLWNNQVGRKLANRRDLKNKNYNELWVYANKHNMIIKNADDVYTFLGLDESYINAETWSVNMSWDLDTGNITFTKPDGSGSVTLKIGV